MSKRPSDARLAQIACVYRRIASVTTRFSFFAPMADADLSEFAQHMRAALAPGFTVSVAREREFVRLRVSEPDGTTVYNGLLLVVTRELR